MAQQMPYGSSMQIYTEFLEGQHPWGLQQQQQQNLNTNYPRRGLFNHNPGGIFGGGRALLSHLQSPIPSNKLGNSAQTSQTSERTLGGITKAGHNLLKNIHESIHTGLHQNNHNQQGRIDSKAPVSPMNTSSLGLNQSASPSNNSFYSDSKKNQSENSSLSDKQNLAQNDASKNNKSLSVTSKPSTQAINQEQHLEGTSMNGKLHADEENNHTPNASNKTSPFEENNEVNLRLVVKKDFENRIKNSTVLVPLNLGADQPVDTTMKTPEMIDVGDNSSKTGNPYKAVEQQKKIENNGSNHFRQNDPAKTQSKPEEIDIGEHRRLLLASTNDYNERDRKTITNIETSPLPRTTQPTDAELRNKELERKLELAQKIGIDGYEKSRIYDLQYFQQMTEEKGQLLQCQVLTPKGGQTLQKLAKERLRVIGSKQLLIYGSLLYSKGNFDEGYRNFDKELDLMRITLKPINKTIGVEESERNGLNEEQMAEEPNLKLQEKILIKKEPVFKTFPPKSSNVVNQEISSETFQLKNQVDKHKNSTERKSDSFPTLVGDFSDALNVKKENLESGSSGKKTTSTTIVVNKNIRAQKEATTDAKFKLNTKKPFEEEISSSVVVEAKLKGARDQVLPKVGEKILKDRTAIAFGSQQDQKKTYLYDEVPEIFEERIEYTIEKVPIYITMAVPVKVKERRTIDQMGVKIDNDPPEAARMMIVGSTPIWFPKISKDCEKDQKSGSARLFGE